MRRFICNIWLLLSALIFLVFCSMQLHAQTQVCGVESTTEVLGVCQEPYPEDFRPMTDFFRHIKLTFHIVVKTNGGCPAPGNDPPDYCWPIDENGDLQKNENDIIPGVHRLLNELNAAYYSAQINFSIEWYLSDQEVELIKNDCLLELNECCGDPGKPNCAQPCITGCPPTTSDQGNLWNTHMKSGTLNVYLVNNHPKYTGNSYVPDRSVWVTKLSASR